MITIEYNPNHTAITDGQVIDYAQQLIELEGTTDPRVNMVVSVGTGLVIDAVRVLIKTRKIASEHVQFKYKDTIINVDEYGRCYPWPEGFNDTMEQLLMQL